MDIRVSPETHWCSWPAWGCKSKHSKACSLKEEGSWAVGITPEWMVPYLLNGRNNGPMGPAFFKSWQLIKIISVFRPEDLINQSIKPAGKSQVSKAHTLILRIPVKWGKAKLSSEYHYPQTSLIWLQVNEMPSAGLPSCPACLRTAFCSTAGGGSGVWAVWCVRTNTYFPN